MKALFIRLYINQELLLRVDPNRCDGLILLLFSRLADTKGQMLCHRYEVPRSKSHVCLLYFNQSQGYVL